MHTNATVQITRAALKLPNLLQVCSVEDALRLCLSSTHLDDLVATSILVASGAVCRPARVAMRIITSAPTHSKRVLAQS